MPKAVWALPTVLEPAIISPNMMKQTRTAPSSFLPTKKEFMSLRALARVLSIQPMAVVTTMYPMTRISSTITLFPQFEFVFRIFGERYEQLAFS